MRKNWIPLLVSASIGILCVCFVAANWKLRIKIGLIERTEDEKQLEFQKKIQDEKIKIKEGFDEKYRADMVSYKAMSIRLKTEKERSDKMRKKLDALNIRPEEEN